MVSARGSTRGFSGGTGEGEGEGGCLVSGFRVNNKKGGGCLTDFLWAFSSSRVLEDIDRCH
jgi:hypothetical protein